MFKLSTFLLSFAFFCSLSSLSVFGQKIGKYPTVSVTSAARLNSIVDTAVEQTTSKFSAKGVTPDNLAVTIIDLSDAEKLQSGSFRGEEKIFPASVAKMFYMVALHQWLENGKTKLTPEIERATKDMVVDSSNEATQFLLDVLTDTSSGSELSEKELAKWGFKRNIVNRYFSSLNYQNINVNQKTFCEGAYGREKQFRGKDNINHNKLTTNAAARLMSEIALRKAVSVRRSEQMLELMKRDWDGNTSRPFDGENQATNFTGAALKELNLKGSKLWSKAGWTSTARHDVAYVETTGGLKLVICIFTANVSTEKEIIPHLAKSILQGISASN